jgi:acetylornithine deacetylase
MLIAAATVPHDVPVMVLLTTDEETTHAGAKVLRDHGVFTKLGGVRAIVIGEPTGMVPIRGHRANVIFTATASGIQAHSATGLGLNANWALLDFLDGMRSLRDRLLTAPELKDDAYEPKVCGFNLLIENPAVSVSATVPTAIARIQFRYSAAVDPLAIAEFVRDRAAKARIRLDERWLGRPLDLPANHEFVIAAEAASGRGAQTQPFNTDACELQSLAPCIIMGPGDISAAHLPGEMVRLADLEAAVPIYVELVERVARLPTIHST